MEAYIIAKGGKELPLFWSRDGWVGNSDLASRYHNEERAWNAVKILGLDKEPQIRVEERNP